MQNQLLYKVALTLVPHIGDVNAKTLIQHCGNAEAVFKASKKELERIDGIGTIRAESIKRFNNFKKAEEEIEFIHKFKIKPLFLTDKDYPQRLLNCYDNPALLYYKGTADLNTSKIVAIVGTRSNSDYGKSICEKLIEDLSDEDVLIISGLAFGIDSIAHRAALKNQLQTVGVLAHGLDRVYPSQNISLAKQMITSGGLLTDFRSGTNPDRQNFPSRNRIAAGMSDCIVVIESGTKGGSIITAEIGNGYNKDVFAFPGRTNDLKSEGCNYLIKHNKAGMICDGNDLLEMMGWKKISSPKRKPQRELFIEFTPDEKVLVDLLQAEEEIHIDQLYFKSKLSSSAIAQALLMLEMQGIVSSLPGKLYKMSD